MKLGEIVCIVLDTWKHKGMQKGHFANGESLKAVFGEQDRHKYSRQTSRHEQFKSIQYALFANYVMLCRRLAGHVTPEHAKKPAKSLIWKPIY